jgi:hypothetical protein
MLGVGQPATVRRATQWPVLKLHLHTRTRVTSALVDIDLSLIVRPALVFALAVFVGCDRREASGTAGDALVQGATDATVDSAADSAMGAIRRMGARRLVDSLIGDAAADTHYFNRVSTGDSAWLEVARVLRAESDAGMSEGFDMALATAILAAPAHALRVAGPPFNFEWVCRPPFMEAPDSVIEKYRERAITALSGVTDPALRQRRDACLAGMRQHAKG